MGPSVWMDNQPKFGHNDWLLFGETARRATTMGGTAVAAFGYRSSLDGQISCSPTKRPIDVSGAKIRINQNSL
jgi:hypothetical protein